MVIQSLELQADGLDALKAFYIDKLGLSGGLGDGRLAIQAGSTQLIFLRGGAAGANHFAFNIPENRIDDAADWLESLGIRLIPDASESRTHEFLSWNADAVYFLDPARNVVELIARHELPNSVDPDAPFTPAEILCVSEIGLATTDVLAKASSLADDFGLPAYREGDETFSPMGDANGLIIVVPVGRAWYPTTDAVAAELPVKIVFATDDGTTYSYPA